MVIKMIYDFLDFLHDNVIWLSIVGAILLLILIFVIVKIIKRHNLHKKPKLKIDEDYINRLIEAFGTKENISNIDVDGNKLKVEVLDVNKCNLDTIKLMANSGVFVVNNTIKTLFMYDSETLRKELNKYKG